jgi:hypothetical protein
VGLVDSKDECTPATSEVARGGYQRRVRMVGTRTPISRKGGGHGKDGKESEEGTALSSFLGASRVTSSPRDRIKNCR